ncbi:MAG: hypothetical protein IT222_07745 [Crocinitomix sp.]|nr:hypothetical protein [Crocinitomix sp.]
MKQFLLVFSLMTSTVFSQVNSRFGFEYGVGGPDISGQVRGSIKTIEQLHINFGLDLYLANTMGRVIGVNYFLGKWGKSENQSLLLGIDYDNTTSGIYNYGDNEVDFGSFLIPQASYLVPKIGFRFYKMDYFLEGVPLDDFSISLVSSYKIPVSYKSLILRNGVYNSTQEDKALQYLKGGLNFSLKIGFWF